MFDRYLVKLFLDSVSLCSYDYPVTLCRPDPPASAFQVLGLECVPPCPALVKLTMCKGLKVVSGRQRGRGRADLSMCAFQPRQRYTGTDFLVLLLDCVISFAY